MDFREKDMVQDNYHKSYENRHETSARTLFDTRAIIGLFIILAGVIYLLRNLGIDLGLNVWEWWPLILILIGLGQVLQPQESRQTGAGIFLLILGSAFLLNNLDIIDFNFRMIWPLILIFIGYSILRKNAWPGRRIDPSSDYINLAFIVGGGDHRFNTQDLKGGKITAIMGGGTIDLTRADFKGDEIALDVFAMWGGIEIRVPESWQVNMTGVPILGSMDNKTIHSADRVPNADFSSKPKRLIIRGTAIMGGVEAKN
ncbi:MAG TPA: hypothetical protein ENK44_07155 [Caldithrix abyssi]|uniref:DUF5668 domain-containing protein n=1 Tax=Caldithrix abyssi TaxID=187145 RepID=A0A7V4WV24_CALAY|nr:hypothetical protein [Caldithrix abyssi]